MEIRTIYKLPEIVEVRVMQHELNLLLLVLITYNRLYLVRPETFPNLFTILFFYYRPSVTATASP